VIGWRDSSPYPVGFLCSVAILRGGTLDAGGGGDGLIDFRGGDGFAKEIGVGFVSLPGKV
jgi:hypothetical protein